jgi:Neutral/alkaline non-lysosomal ceramidase.
MKAAFKRVDITPPLGIPIGGNCREDSSSRGVHDSLYADIMVLSQKEDMVVFIDIDWCEAPLEVVREMKSKIAKNTGARYERLCVTMTHTHSGPDVFGILSPNGILPSTWNYINDAAENIANGLSKALTELEDVLIGLGKGYEDRLSFNRRVFFKDDVLHMNWEILENPDIDIKELDRPEGPIDPDIYVIKICDVNGGLKAVVVNFTLHPAILVGQDFLFSKDYIWGLEKSISDTYGEGVFVYFANGAEGNINHINMWDKTQERGWNEANRIGSLLGVSVKNLVDSINVKPVDNMKLLYKSINVQVREISEEEIATAEKIWTECKGVIPGLVDGIPPEWYAGNILKIVKEGAGTKELELQVVCLGDISIVTFPGEFFTEFGLKLKEKSPFENTMIFGLANQSIGYVPTREAFGNGGYEPVTCETSILVHDAGDIVVEEILGMLNEIR